MNTERIAFLAAAALTAGACAGNGDDKPDEKPPIVEVFACSDYCPGPEERYLKRVYEGVEDEQTCRELGGRPYVYVGWGEFFVCVAE